MSTVFRVLPINSDIPQAGMVSRFDCGAIHFPLFTLFKHYFQHADDSTHQRADSVSRNDQKLNFCQTDVIRNVLGGLQIFKQPALLADIDLDMNIGNTLGSDLIDIHGQRFRLLIGNGYLTISSKNLGAGLTVRDRAGLKIGRQLDLIDVEGVENDVLVRVV